MKPFKSFILSFALIALSFSVKAQPGITKVSVLTDSVKDALDFPKFSNAPAIVRLPIVEYVSKTIPVVEVKIEGVPYRFIFDTGSSNTLFNSIFIVQSPGDSIVPMGVATGANSSRRIFGLVKASNFELGEFKVDELVMTTTSYINPGTPEHGVIGLSLVRDYDLLFDWPNREILLINPDSIGVILDKQYKIIESIPISYYSDPDYICTDCLVNGKRVRLQIDTGAYRTLLPDDLSNRGKRHVKKNLLKVKKGRGYQIQYKEYTSDRVNISLGNKTYRSAKVILGENVRSERHDFGGMLGGNVLKRQPILISMKSEELLLLKHR